MAPRVGIDTEKQIVFIRVDFDYTIQVAWLEPGVELQLLLFADGGVHALECAIIYCVAVELVLAHGFLS